MKLISYLKDGRPQAALLVNNQAYDLQSLDSGLPDNMEALLQDWARGTDKLREQERLIGEGKCHVQGVDAGGLVLLAPVTRPTSCRDGYAFRQHVAAARRNRKVEMIAEFDEYPIWYFTNHNAVQGPGEIRCMPDHFQRLDFELEAAVVLGKKGRNFSADKADDYIAGYTIMNDMSARLLQMEEMKLNLGPAKGKDFSTAIGPWLVTPDELEQYRTQPKAGHTGNAFDLKMVCRVNGVQVSQGSMGDMDWTFAEIIERCAYGADVYPGDVIGSGTVGTGCFLELNGTGLLNDPAYKTQWLQAGDKIEMEISGLGQLDNSIVAEDSDFSLLALKKEAHAE